MSTPRQRWLVLGASLAVTVALAAWLSMAPSPPEVVEAKPRAAAGVSGGARNKGSSGKSAKSEPVPLAALAELRAGQHKAASGDEEVKDIFAAQTWFVPPPPGVAPPPEAPPLPFTYLGKLKDNEDNGGTRVFIATKDRNLVVKAGDVIDGTYRIEAIGPTAMTFRYLPMDKQQTLEIGRAP